MPLGDRTGPTGLGPMTGRAAGYCAGYSVPGYMNPYGGRGLGLARGFRGGGGRGFGRGYGRGFGYPISAAPYEQPAYTGYVPGAVPQYTAPGAPVYSGDQELEMMKNQADYLASTLEGIKQRIDELESKTAEDKTSGKT